MASKTRLPFVLAGVALAMLAAAFASKPLYNSFCRVTGFGGTTQRANAGADRVLDRTMTVRFDANAAAGAPVEFAPEQREQTARIGENSLAYFHAANRTDQPVSIVATFNVTPFKAGRYFNKIQCFCFTQQTLSPGESVDMPVIYFVDPALDEDRQLDDVTTITLSYTFFPTLEDAADLAASKSPAEAAGGEG